jgi:hypothetical protein
VLETVHILTYFSPDLGFCLPTMDLDCRATQQPSLSYQPSLLQELVINKYMEYGFVIQNILLLEFVKPPFLYLKKINLRSCRDHHLPREHETCSQLQIQQQWLFLQ